MTEEFKRFIQENDLIKDSDTVLLAVSGGIDSMVMAHLFVSSGIKTAIAHCNFNLRGKESDGDESFVKKFASRHKIPFHSVGFDTTGFATEKNISIQMAARELRYRWFEEVRREHKYDLIALGHNLNDNVETFLINLTRGTGISGLTGMNPRYRYLIRPLLFATRKSITEYSHKNGIDFREDRSNSDTKYIRNKFRHQIIPLLREINPSFDTTIEETAKKLGEVNEIVTGVISDIRNRSSKQRDNLVLFRIKDLNNITPKRTILFELFRPYGVSPGQIDDLINLTSGKTGSQMFTPAYRLLRNRNEIIISPREKESESYYEISSVEDFQKLHGCKSAEIIKIGTGFKIPRSSNIACFDSGKISFPMIIRKWAPGDSFYPLGMKNKKKLSDYFIDNKLSILEKESCLLLESAGRIAWIIGYRIDNRFKITESSRNALIIKLQK